MSNDSILEVSKYLSYYYGILSLGESLLHFFDFEILHCSVTSVFFFMAHENACHN